VTNLTGIHHLARIHTQVPNYWSMITDNIMAQVAAACWAFNSAWAAPLVARYPPPPPSVCDRPTTVIQIAKSVFVEMHVGGGGVSIKCLPQAESWCLQKPMQMPAKPVGFGLQKPGARKVGKLKASVAAFAMDSDDEEA